MIPPTITGRAQLGHAIAHAAEDLPEDWVIAVVITQGDIDVELHDPAGEEVLITDSVDDYPSSLVNWASHIAQDRHDG